MNSLSIRKKNELSKKKKKGFTLIELIIVIAIIAILAAIALPRFGQIRESGNVKADLATAKNIQTAISTGLANGDIPLPTADGTSVTLSTVLSGDVPKAKARETKGDTFSATVDKDGTIHVSAGTTPIYPSPSAPYNLS